MVPLGISDEPLPTLGTAEPVRLALILHACASGSGGVHVHPADRVDCYGNQVIWPHPIVLGSGMVFVCVSAFVHGTAPFTTKAREPPDTQAVKRCFIVSGLISVFMLVTILRGLLG
jgi:hypothetical protein